jgi:hypothetical protein
MKGAEMRVITLIAVVILAGCQGSMYGTGQVILSRIAQQQFQFYTKKVNPGYFALSMDGRDVGWNYCPVMSCTNITPSMALDLCRRTAETECKIYAAAGRVVWNYDAPAPSSLKRVTPTFLAKSDDKNFVYCENTAGKVAFSGGGTCTRGWKGWHEISFARFKERFKEGHYRLHASDNTTAASTSKSSEQFKRDLMRCVNSEGTIRTAIGQCKSDETALTEAEFESRIAEAQTAAKFQKPTSPKPEPSKSKEQEVASKPRSVPSNSSVQSRTAPVALEWEGFGKLIAGTIEYRVNKGSGKLAASLPNGIGECAGTYQYNKQQSGTWSVACTNGLSASGTMKAFGPHKGAEGQGTDIKGRKVRFTVGPAQN